MISLDRVAPETADDRWCREDLTPGGDTILYRAWDTFGGLLYVGITGDPIGRWRTHARKSTWWRYVSVLALECYAKRYVALDAERDAIRHERPEFNKRSVVLR